MEPTPLTKKMQKILLEGTELSHPAQSAGAKATIKKDWHLYQNEDVAVAVEYLKQSLEDVYYQLGKREVFAHRNDEICDMAEELFKKKINEAFPCFAEEKK